MKTNEDNSIIAVQNPPERNPMIFQKTEIAEHYKLASIQKLTEKLKYGIIIRSYKNKIIKILGKHNIKKKINEKPIQTTVFNTKLLIAI